MKPILIIKAGTTLPVIKTEHGDFDDWIVSGTGRPRSDFLVTPVYQKVPLPQPEFLSGVIISGSHANVTDEYPWLKTTSRWIKSAIKQDLPVLGICFGHQLLAHALGGRVGFHPKGWELGRVQIEQTGMAADDPLFRILPQHFSAFASHEQSVPELPAGAVALAQNNFEPHHAIRFAPFVWGVQFHPEFICTVMNAYLSHYQKETVSCRDSEFGSTLLKQFVTIVEKR